MRGAVFAAGLLLALMTSGCLADNDGDGNPDSGLFAKEKVVAKGDSLGGLTFDDEGSIMSAVTQPDCMDGGGTSETHQWQIPADDGDGVPWKADSLTVTVVKAPTMPDIDVTLQYDGREIASATETGPDEEDTVTVTATDVPPGQLTIIIRACTTATGDYTVEGVADMVASADVYKNGSTGDIDSSTPGGAGAVTVEPKTDSNGNTYYEASRQETYTATLTGDTGTADISTGAGNVIYIASSGNDYELVAYLKARGDSEQEARDRLAEMYVDHTAQDGAAVLLDVHGRPGGDGQWRKKQIDLEFAAPAAIDWTTYAVTTAAGNLIVDSVTATSMDLDTSAGNIDATGSDAGTLEITTSAGNILIQSTKVGDATVSSSAGNIVATMDASTQSGTWDMDASAGNVDLSVEEPSSIGYDVDARTSAGTVTFGFDEVEETSSDCQYASCHREGRTQGYDSRGVQVTLDLDVSAGNIVAGS